MPHYYFNVFDDVTAIDGRGLDLPHLGAAHVEAVRGARSLIATQIAGGRKDLTGRIEIEDEGRRSVLVIPFRDVQR